MGYRLADRGSYLEIIFTGTCNGADLQAMADELLVFESQAAVVPPRLTDMTGIERLDFGFPGISELADRRKATTITGPIRSAILVGNQAQFGMARMFQTLNDHPAVEVEIFRDRNEAVAWLAGGGERRVENGGLG